MKKLPLFLFFICTAWLMAGAQNPNNNAVQPNPPLKETRKEKITKAVETVLVNKDYLTGAGKVINVEVLSTPGFAAGCNESQKHFEFRAAITTDGPCTVQYEWKRSDNATDSYAPRTVSFAAAGTQIVTQTWDIWLPDYEGWQAVHITAPNNLISNKAGIKIICCNNATGGNECQRNPWQFSPCSQSLLSTLKYLVSGDGVRNCHPTLNFPTRSGRMPEGCYSFQTTSASNVSYSTFYIPTMPEFRVIWGSQASQFAYYGACPPSPIEFPHPGIIENHVFAAKLIKKSDYMAFTGSPKNYVTMGSVAAVNPADIAGFDNISMEENGGYISATEAVQYNNVLSSKGVVVKVRMRDGSTHDCYLINNYDEAGTIVWKQRNPSCR